MREATGSALLTMMVVGVITIIMLFFVGSLSYSKAYKIKNYIVNQIEENRGWEDSLTDSFDSYLKEAGYYVKGNSTCPSKNGKCSLKNTKSQYQYCIYECENGSSASGSKNVYYKVITYSKFELPVIKNLVTFKVKGETETFNDFN